MYEVKQLCVCVCKSCVWGSCEIVVFECEQAGYECDRRHHVGLLGTGARSKTWNEPELTQQVRLQQTVWFESLPLDVALACCRLLHACRPLACARQGALAHCPCRHTRLEAERRPQAHKTASSRTPANEATADNTSVCAVHAQWRAKRCKVKATTAAIKIGEDHAAP